MRLGKDLIGKPIFSAADGKYVGDVKDLYLDPDAISVVGIFLGKEGLISRKDLLIPRDNVVVFGLDAILVKDANAATDSNQYAPVADWLRRNRLQGRDIDTPGGTKVGTVGDVIVDTNADILGFSLARVFVEGPVAEKRLISRGAVQDVGERDGVMTVDLSLAESATLDALPAEIEEEPLVFPEEAEVLPDLEGMLPEEADAGEPGA